MKTYSRFNLSLISLTLPSLLLIALFNIAIDPYGVHNAPKILKFNSLKPAQYNNVKLFKAVRISQVKPKTIFLGSSRTGIGLDPSHPAITNQPSYNLALVGSNINEINHYLKHAIANQPKLNTVILGIDFFMFNKFNQNGIDFDLDRLNKTRITNQDFFNTVLSTDAVASSIETIKANINPQEYYLFKDNGHRYTLFKSSPDIPNKFKQSISGYLNKGGFYYQYKISPEFMNRFREIVELCEQNNIDLKVFISPSHATQWEAIHTAGIWSDFEQWKREIIKITPVWDFSGYNSITTEAINKEMNNYWDSSHYTQAVGDLILNKILHHKEKFVPKDFGVWITPQNIESHIYKIQHQRRVWIENNPNIAQFVKQIKQTVIIEK